jgi:uncharacterized membrane protein YhfC
MLNEHIIQLTKKRGQLKAAVTKMVQVTSFIWIKRKFFVCLKSYAIRMIFFAIWIIVLYIHLYHLKNTSLKKIENFTGNLTL